MTSGATLLVRSSLGLESVAYRETTDFDAVRSWIGAVQRDLRLIDTALSGSPSAAFLENAGVALTPNGVPIQDLPSYLLFSCQDAPVALRRTAVTDSDVYEVLPIEVYPESGVGATGSGPRIHARCLDDAGDLVDVATIDFPLTSAASVALGGAGHAAKIVFSAATAGVLEDIGEWSGAGALTLMQAGVAFATLEVVGGPTFRMRSAAGMTGGASLASAAGPVGVEAASALTLRANGGAVNAVSSTSTLNDYGAGVVLSRVSTLTPNGAHTIVHQGGTTSVAHSVAKKSGNGATVGGGYSITAGQGQDVAGGTNNDGGPLSLLAGAVGTGGTGGSVGPATFGNAAGTLLIRGDGSTEFSSTDVEWGTSQGGVWMDLHATMMPPTAGATIPALTAVGGGSAMFLPQWAVNDQTWVQWHINHDYVPGSSIYFHFHWTTDGTSTNTTKWQFTYYHARGHQQEAFSPALNGAGTVVTVTQAAQGTAYYHMVAETAAVTIANLEPDSIILCEIKRITNGGTDNADRVFGLMGQSADLHYLSSRPGTKNRAFPFT
jgi:hypothetical protein